MKPLVRRKFRCYIISCIEKIEYIDEAIGLPISEIPNRNSEQVPEQLWQELIINHMYHEKLS